MKQTDKQKNKGQSYSAFDTAAYYLSFKDRTVKEITDKLKEKGYSEEETIAAVSKLIHYGYLDDFRYAKAYIREHRCHKGINLLKRELYLKGVDRDIVSETVECMDSDEFNEIETVRDIYKRRFENSDVNDEKQRRKIFAYFQRRGFLFDNVKKVIGDFDET
jgi:regulatory protein